MFKKIIVALAVLVVILLALGYYLMRGPDLAQFEPLRQPRMTTLPAQKVIMVETRGAPSQTAGPALGLLFKTYFKIKGAGKGPHQSAPKSRWPVADTTDPSTWTGRFAMAVPEAVTEVPPVDAPAGLKVVLTTWEYGDVAEILHVGPYSREKPTVQKLLDFIKIQGCEVVGEHEEEYLKGPGMFGPGDPEKYYTIIRYRVKKTEPAAE
jgi:hypothetical protein